MLHPYMNWIVISTLVYQGLVMQHQFLPAHSTLDPSPPVASLVWIPPPFPFFQD
jgi:hypothetical protein